MIRKLSREEMERRKKAESLRYKKAAVSGLTYFEIQTKLEEITEACDDVIYWIDSDEESLVDALEGNYEDAERFQLDFAMLQSDVQQMQMDMDQIEEPDSFNDILVVSGIGRQRGESLFGYDAYEGDYFGIDPFQYEWSELESTKRLMRLTKGKLLEQLAVTVSITYAFLGIQSRYQDLKAAMDLLRAKNKEYLDSVKALNALYDSIDFTDQYASYTKDGAQYESFLQMLPQEAYL